MFNWRYTQPDPLGLEGGWNRFTYVENNPIWATDPQGLQAAATWSDVSRVALPSIGGACAATGGAACAAAAVGAVGVGSYVLTDRYVNPWLQPWISRGIDACINAANSCSDKSCNWILNESGSNPLDVSKSAGHTAGARPSTEEKHQRGDARRKTDRGGEKGDSNRNWPRKKPDGWKGPWPPTGA